MPLSDETIRAQWFFRGRKRKAAPRRLRDGPLFIPSISDTAQPRRRMPWHGLEDALDDASAPRAALRAPEVCNLFFYRPGHCSVLRASMSAVSVHLRMKNGPGARRPARQPPPPNKSSRSSLGHGGGGPGRAMFPVTP